MLAVEPNRTARIRSVLLRGDTDFLAGRIACERNMIMGRRRLVAHTAPGPGHGLSRHRHVRVPPTPPERRHQAGLQVQGACLHAVAPPASRMAISAQSRRDCPAGRPG